MYPIAVIKPPSRIKLQVNSFQPGAQNDLITLKIRWHKKADAAIYSLLDIEYTLSMIKHRAGMLLCTGNKKKLLESIGLVEVNHLTVSRSNAAAVFQETTQHSGTNITYPSEYSVRKKRNLL